MFLPEESRLLISKSKSSDRASQPLSEQGIVEEVEGRKDDLI